MSNLRIRSMKELLACLALVMCIFMPDARADERVVVHNLYFPKPGLERQVLDTRLEASRVRRDLGLSVGRVLLRTSEANGQPYVIWECDYPSLAAREKDAAAAEGAAAFKKVQQKMSGLIQRFERLVWQEQQLSP
jgi:hypothetical protein